MILQLTIRHIALIDQLTIDFHGGMHVLSGETGAGKSIVIDAVNLVLGGRADRTLIRNGCDTASVEAVFDLPDQNNISAFMAEKEIPFDGRTVTVYRELSVTGRNICRLCGVIVPVTTVKELSGKIMDIHGQHDHQFLMDASMHLAFLDRLGGENHQKLLLQTSAAYRAFIACHRRYAGLVRKKNEKEIRLPQVQTELTQLRKANLKPGEEEILEKRCKQLSNEQKLMSGIREAYSLLTEDASGKGSLDRIRETAALLNKVSELDSEVSSAASRCETLAFELEDLSYEISKRIGASDDESGKLERAEQRLELIRKLKKKYGSTLEEILMSRDRLEKEYNMLSGLEEQLTETSAEHKKLLAEYRKIARELTESRKRISSVFENNMMKELKSLGMKDTVFQVKFYPAEEKKPVMPSENGDDRIEFLISPNPGEPPKPLALIASGGELSRMMLAFKVLESDHSGIQTMVFDEIDTGISGRMAQAVSEKMILISKDRQVICVSHLPQIAAAADHAYLVEKSVSADRTYTVVRELSPVEHIAEVGRMLSGANGITDEAHQYAAQMIAGALALKAGAACSGI